MNPTSTAQLRVGAETSNPAVAGGRSGPSAKAAHYATLCHCHRDLWGPLCAPHWHGTVPLVLDPDAAKRIVNCLTCLGDMARNGMFDV